MYKQMIVLSKYKNKTLLKLFLFSFIILFASFIYFAFNNNVFKYYSVQKYAWVGNNLKAHEELLAKNKMSGNFIAKDDGLANISVPLYPNNRINSDIIEFRIKEKGKLNWYFGEQFNTTNTNQFQNDIPFSIIIPVVKNSKNKAYYFEIESLKGISGNAISASNEKFFLLKYKFTKSDLVKNPSKIIQFSVSNTIEQLWLLATGNIIFILLILPLFIIYLLFINRKKMIKYIIVTYQSNILKKLVFSKSIFYIVTICGFLIFLLSGLITRGHSINNLFISDRTNYFMDFYNNLQYSFSGSYAYGSIYPPLPQLIYRLLLRLIPYDIAGYSAYAMRATQSGEIVLLLYMLITLLLFFVLIMEIKKGTRIEKYVFAFIILFSAPFLHQFERANIIFVALLFLMIFVFFKDSKNRIVREFALVCLAISAGIKLYPVLFGLLLIKDRRYKDIFKVIIYGLALFILPFFVLGGINQLPILLKNIFFTVGDITKWGVGYSVSIQNLTRILFGFAGRFGNNPIIIGKIFSLIMLILGLFLAFILSSKWKTVSLLCLLIIMVPTISFEYSLIFMVIPLIMFLDRDEKEKFDYLYMACFSLIFIPFSLGKVDIINNGFGNPAFPLTYGVLIQNIALLIMASCLMWEGLMGDRLKPARAAFILKISNQLSKLEKFYWIIPVFIILVYNLIYFNKYLPITEGWFSTYAWLFNHGQFPYKDFYFFLTPFYLIKMSLFTSIFGYDIFFLRIFGIGVILLTTYFLYKNFEIIFKAPIAAFVATVGMIYYQSGVAHITYDFTQFVALYGLIQSYFLLKYIQASDLKSQLSIKWVFLAGLFASLIFLTKQSNGIVITAFSFAGLFILSLLKGKREVLKTSLSYIGGFAVPVVLTVLWLLANSAFIQFFQQVFTGAVSAKGGLNHIFFGWFKEITTYDFIVRFGEILFIVLVFGYWMHFLKGEKRENENLNRFFMLISSLAILLIVFLPLFGHITDLNKLSELGRMGLNHGTVAAISISVISILTGFIFFILKKTINKNIFLFSFVSLGFIYATGTSAGLSEGGVFAGFCLFIALMLHYRSILSLGKIFIILFCISFSLIWIEAKYERPYYWWSVTSTDIRGKLQTTNKINLLHGVYASPDNIKLIEEVTREISSGSKPSEPVLTFPNIPIFYLLTDRRPPGKALVYWFDFLPDSLALKEAEAIKENPPKVIVYLDLGPSVWEAHENLFRNGKPSGQRKIVEAFMEIIKSKKMHISKKYNLQNNVTLMVWRN